MPRRAARPKPAGGEPRAFELRVTLLEIEPEIWRRVRVPHDVRLDRLHAVLQILFGWTNSHLHQFELFDQRGVVHTLVKMRGSEDSGGWIEPELQTRMETDCTLGEFLTAPGDRLGYEYDFGDGWRHEVELVAVESQATRPAHALCLDGARAGPPDDSGGPPGYEQMLSIVANPRHRDHAHFKEWLGDHDPEAFDLAAINHRLARLKL
jgi:hypothetical protein